MKFLYYKDPFIHDEFLSKRASLFERETLEKVRGQVENYLCDNYPDRQKLQFTLSLTHKRVTETL